MIVLDRPRYIYSSRIYIYIYYKHRYTSYIYIYTYICIIGFLHISLDTARRDVRNRQGVQTYVKVI